MQKRQTITVVTPEGEYRRAMRLTIPHAGNDHTALVKVMFSHDLIRVPVDA